MDGIVLIDKPSGPTSADLVRQIKRRVKPARVGHLGTLDPLATGVLPILIGEATKLAPFLHDGGKHYEGLIALGAETDTLDRTGAIVRTAEVPPLDAGRLGAIAASLTGIITQTPPAFSAIKRGGVRLYELARRGEEVAPPPRQVEIAHLELSAMNAVTIRFSMTCSPGTYVRSLARDIGLALDSAAHLAELRRIRTGGFSIDNCCPLGEALAALDRGDAPSIIGMRAALPDLPEVVVEDLIAARLRNGDSRALIGLVPAPGGFFKVIVRDELLAIAEATTPATALITRVFGTSFA